MIGVLLLIGLASSLWGAFAVKRAPTYRAEEGDDVTVGWDSHTTADLSLTSLVCFLQSEPLRRFYKLIRGEEVAEAQHEQFAGRVRCDRDALRGGRVRLHLSRVAAADSGGYWCDLVMRGWVLKTTERFVLNVTSRGENRDVSLATPESPEGAQHTPGGPKEEGTSPDWNKVKTALGAANVGLIIVAGLIFLVDAAVRGLASLFCRDGSKQG